MNLRPDRQAFVLLNERTLPLNEQAPETPIPIEVQMGIPAWIMRDPGPAIEIEDDQCKWL